MARHRPTTPPTARLTGGVGAGAYGRRHDDGPGHVRRPGHAPVVGDLRRRRPRDHRREPGRVRHHRDRRGQGARRRGGRRVPDPRQPGRAIPAFISVLTGITDAHGGRRPAHRVGAARRSSSSPPASVLVAHNAGFDICFLKAAARAHRARVARLRRARHPAPRPPARAARRGAQPPARLAGRSSARRRRPTTAPCTTPGRPSTCSTASSSGSATSACARSRSSRATAHGSPRRSGASGSSPTRCRTRPGSTSSRTATAGCSMSARAATSAPGSAPTSPPPSSAAGWARWCASPSRCTRRLPDAPRGPGARAAAHRRAQAALQPEVQRRTQDDVGQAHHRALPAAVDRQAGARRRRPLHRPVPLPPRPPSPPSTPCTRSCRCASAPSGSPRPAASACALADMGRCGAPCTGAQSEADYAIVSPTAPSISRSANARPARRPARANDDSPSTRALRGRPGRARAAGRPGARHARARSASTRWRASPSWSPPGARCSAAGRSSACGTAGSPAAPRRHAAPTRCRTSRRCGPARRSSPRRWPPCPAATPEESEKILRWLESPGVRIVEIDGAWTCPVGGAAAVRAELEPLETARREVAGFAGVR